MQPEVRDGSRLRSRLSTPGSTHATRSSASTSSTRFSWVVTITTGSSTGVAPPASPVPLPRATNGRSWRARDPHRGRDLVGRRAGSTPRRRAPRRRPRRARTSASSSGSARARSGPSDRLAGRRGARRCRRCAETTTRSSRDPAARRRRYARRIMSRRDRDRRPVPRASGSRFADPGEDGRTWQIDVTFLLSSWQCIFGCGCQGVLDRTGARARPRVLLLRRALLRQGRPRPRREGGASELGDDEWQFAKIGREEGHLREGRQGRRRPRSGRPASCKDACIFLNRPGFAAGAGLRAAPARDATRASTSASPSPRSAGSCRCGASTTSRTTASVISAPHRVRPRRLGRGRRGLRAGGAPRRPRRSPATRAGVPSRWRSSCARCSARSCYQQVVEVPRRAARGGRAFAAGRASRRGAGEAQPQEATEP